MNTYRVSELEGALLDAAVAKALGYDRVGAVPDEMCGLWYAGESDGGVKDWTPSTDWGQAGPIIEREQMSIVRMGGAMGYWHASYELGVDDGVQCESGWIEMPAITFDGECLGTTALVAAMRCYVRSKFGDTVELAC